MRCERQNRCPQRVTQGSSAVSRLAFGLALCEDKNKGWRTIFRSPTHPRSPLPVHLFQLMWLKPCKITPEGARLANRCGSFKKGSVVGCNCMGFVASSRKIFKHVGLLPGCPTARNHVSNARPWLGAVLCDQVL